MEEFRDVVAALLMATIFVLAICSFIFTGIILSEEGDCEHEHNVYDCKIIAVPVEVGGE